MMIVIMRGLIFPKKIGFCLICECPPMIFISMIYNLSSAYPADDVFGKAFPIVSSAGLNTAGIQCSM